MVITNEQRSATFGKWRVEQMTREEWAKDC